jgi:hypothetical protein
MHRYVFPKRLALFAFGLTCLGGNSCFGAEYPISGVNPAERPAGAPTITEHVKGQSWYSQALTGLAAPYPSSFSFLENQGAWYTPFIHPGMPGYYDLRGWHERR